MGRGSGQERITEKKTLTTEGEQQSAVKRTTKKTQRNRRLVLNEVKTYKRKRERSLKGDSQNRRSHKEDTPLPFVCFLM